MTAQVMKQLLFALTLLLSLSVQAHAEWTVVRNQVADGPRLYVDYATMRFLENENPTVWTMMDYKMPALSGSLSTMLQFEFDCAKSQRRLTAYLTFSDHMAKGAPRYVQSPARLAREIYVPVRPGSAAHELMTHVCSVS